MYIHINYADFARLAETLSVHLGRSEATISTWIDGQARLFSRAREGKGCTAHKYQKVMTWFHENWPEDLEWPHDIPRPMPIDAAAQGDAA